jgi:hypothetical protein
LTASSVHAATTASTLSIPAPPSSARVLPSTSTCVQPRGRRHHGSVSGRVAGACGVRRGHGEARRAVNIPSRFAATRFFRLSSKKATRVDPPANSSARRRTPSSGLHRSPAAQGERSTKGAQREPRQPVAAAAAAAGGPLRTHGVCPEHPLEEPSQAEGLQRLQSLLLAAVCDEVFRLGEGLEKGPHGRVRLEEAIWVRADDLRTRNGQGGPTSYGQ